jgi:FKBP-type peptidyl-prolyl cis-trans isomerase FkpA
MTSFSRILVSAIFLSLFFTGCAMNNPSTSTTPQAPATPPTPPYPSSTTTLVKLDSVVGTGAVADVGKTTRVHYTGWLFVPGANGAPGTKGSKFDSSLDRNDPFEFTIGQRRVIGGWEQGVAGMAVGGKRTLIIPPDLGYGARGAGGVIPPNATLVFEIELLGVR